MQDLIRRDSAKIWSQIEHDKASLFVCGDAKHMAADVAVNALSHTATVAKTHRQQVTEKCACVNSCAQAALHAIVETEGGLDKSQAAKYVADLKKAGRYLQDVW